MDHNSGINSLRQVSQPLKEKYDSNDEARKRILRCISENKPEEVSKFINSIFRLDEVLLQEICKHCDITVVTTVLQRFPNSINRLSGEDLLIDLCRLRSEDVVLALINAGANVTGTKLYKSVRIPLLFVAIFHSQMDVARRLFELGVSANTADESGRQALHFACASRCLQNGNIVKMLLDHGANINAKDNDGSTPRDYALNSNQSHIVKILDDFVENK